MLAELTFIFCLSI